jgi:hypothetical protein
MANPVLHFSNRGAALYCITAITFMINRIGKSDKTDNVQKQPMREYKE